MSIGALGAGGVNTTGSNAGNTTVTVGANTICVANGGSGGVTMISNTSVSAQSGGLGGVAGVCTPTACDIAIAGQAGGVGQRNGTINGFHGDGGSTVFGSGGPGRSQTGVGIAGTGYGAGGSGSGTSGGLSTNGGAGTAGAVRITEFK
jgi:hypothetical protein